MLEKYDITEKPVPVGSIAVDYSNPADMVVSIKTGPEELTRVYFGQNYTEPTLNHFLSTPWVADQQVYRP